MMRAASLLYHDVYHEASGADSSGFGSAEAQRYKLSDVQFRAHMEALHGLHAISVLTPTPPDKLDSAIHLTFDDGGASSLLIADLLEARQWIGHFFVATDQIGLPGFLNAAEILALHRRGHVVGSHSASHPLRMSSCSDEELKREWQRSRDRLKEVLGEAVTVASIPGGAYSKRVALHAAHAGFRFLFTSEPTTAAAQIGECLVMGRFAVWAHTSPEQAAALARGTGFTRSGQRISWNAKKIAKAVAGPAYLTMRRLLLSRSQ